MNKAKKFFEKHADKMIGLMCLLVLIFLSVLVWHFVVGPIVAVIWHVLMCIGAALAVFGNGFVLIFKEFIAQPLGQQGLWYLFWGLLSTFFVLLAKTIFQ